MTIRFAGASAGGKSPVHAWRCRSVPLCAANDNGADRLANATVVAALRLFAHYGLGAAEHAGALAQTARREGDPDACRHWLAVCHQLDGRMADRLGTMLGSFVA
jgi:hypothetical protein